MRQFGTTFNRLFEQWMFLLIPGSLLLGFLFADGLLPFVAAVPALFAVVTFTMGLGCGLGQLRHVLARPWPMLWTLLLAHIALPLAAYAIGVFLYGPESPYVIGLVLFALIPLGVSSVIWVGLSGGSVAMMLSLVVIDSLISPFVVPAGIGLLFGDSIRTDTGAMMADLLLIVVVPTIAGVLLNQATKGRITERMKPVTGPVSKLCFTAVVALNAAAIEPHVVELKADMAKLVPVVVLFVGICYAAGFFGVLPLRSRELAATASYATGMRNISLGIVIALQYFSPLAAVPVVLAILVQQPVATLHHYVLQKLHKKEAGQPVSRHVG
ncbi:bile acid:sodium symporter [Paenibacillus darwinianus]|uniref:Bile acid:sodium symporter n=1 Tax=Paenibacillus darwinianus TaxID=1380763 RepID=A0A9W5RZU2_9BACL|nr:bile acid:sodium symporter family protein [Paenibacillus darwinianus]EXX86597.1 bile acid:sodium symporter [Paenibacillus darwinianus]EXX87317.1 bile acid:sodium symporter [Paenibacillus darwinianus]EXX87325.1 bile acid:sodium symporter [Paenibacillus darwinianus]